MKNLSKQKKNFNSCKMSGCKIDPLAKRLRAIFCPCATLYARANLTPSRKLMYFQNKCYCYMTLNKNFEYYFSRLIFSNLKKEDQ